MLHPALIAALLSAAPGVPPQLPKLNRASHNSRGVALRVCPGGCGNNLEGSSGQAITFTRASAGAFCQNLDGSGSFPTSGNPCLVKTASGGTTYGVRIRPAITNVAQFSNAFGTSPWATFNTNTGGTCPAMVVTNGSTDVTAPDGTNPTKLVMSACSGAGNFQIVSQTFTGTAATYAFSLWARTLSGSCSTYLQQETNASVYARNLIAVTPAWQQFQVTETQAAAAGDVFQVGTDLRDGSQTSTSACTIYVWLGQEEQNGQASDGCATAGATATCNAETATLSAVTPGLGVSFCASVTATAAWSSGASVPENDLFGAGTYSTANFWGLSYQSPSWLVYTFDNTNTAKTWTFTQAGLVSGSTHHVRLCYDGAGDTPLLTVDSAGLAANAPTGTGTGVIASQGALNVGWMGFSGSKSSATESNFSIGACGAGPAGIAACAVAP